MIRWRTEHLQSNWTLQVHDNIFNNISWNLWKLTNVINHVLEWRSQKKHAIITLTLWIIFVVVFLICRPLWINNACNICWKESCSSPYHSPQKSWLQKLFTVNRLNLPTSILVHSEGSGAQAWSWFCTWGTCRLETTCTTSPVRRRIALEWEKPWCSWTSNVSDDISCSLISVIFSPCKLLF